MARRKSFIGSAVLGTWAAWDPRPKSIKLSVNGELRQDSTTDLMVHKVDDPNCDTSGLVWDISWRLHLDGNSEGSWENAAGRLDRMHDGR